MPSERWHRLERIFAEALEHPGSARPDFLERACGPDESMRDEVRLLLAAAEQSGDFLDAPAVEVFARQIVREGWTVQPGDRIGSYIVERRLGRGATGEVWRARDERLARHVAIKLLLPQASSVERVRAFEREARSAGTLNHPNVLTVYDVGQHGSAPFLVTECLDGESLRVRLAGGVLPIDSALEIIGQVARGLGAAHDRGIVHRDLKPENILLANDGRVKILDFGLATLLDAAPATSVPESSARAAGRVLAAGTAGYMAPEQVRGDAVDRRADIFALGVVLYEMLAGARPFQGNSALEIQDASVRCEPRDLAQTNPEVSRELAGIVRRCLAKQPDDRFASAADLLAALDPVIRARHPASPPTLLALLRRPVVMATTVLALLAMIAGARQWRVNTSRARWARTIAAPEIQRLANHGDYAEAFVLARQALDIVSDDPHLRQLWLDVSVPAAMTTEPPGADVAFASYRTPTTWVSLGRTPLANVRIPRTLIRLRVSKPGFQSIEGSGALGALPRYRLDPVAAVPPGMVHVVRGRGPVWLGPNEVEDFWIDRFEVTNREFKVFVDGGGYLRHDYWHEPFVERGRAVPWEEAVGRFRDTTGRLGPATWASGTYPAGQADFPVGGVSWYEAAAYAAFAGKSLPTIYHWYRAAGLGRFADILTVSNFNGKGPAAVGSFAGVGPFGTLDMAGNVKEWCWNAIENGRFLLGGAWNEAQYMFADEDARSPFDRAPVDGLRLAKYSGPLPSALTSPVRDATARRDARSSKPVGDEIFAVYRTQYAYDRTPLNAVLEATEAGTIWRKDTVAFDAAYGGERMRAYLFLPNAGLPPYQTVIFFPGGGALQLRSSRDMSLETVDFIVRSGRALLYPVYKGTYERGTGDERGPNAEHDLRIAWSRDLARAIDYVDTRADIDRTRLAFYGVSAGADAGVTLAAVEPRLKTVVLQGTGLSDNVPPEIDPVNYAPRIVVPTLMLNGRYDFGSPVDTSQRPLFALLGAAAGQKRHAIIESGHALSIDDVTREILPWLDRYLGRVVR
jgi:tRNA A-37 threonylcarbamoyl transferase component Bud32/dienelactone hydrolase